MKKVSIIAILLIIAVFVLFNKSEKTYKVGVLSHANVADASFKGFKEGLEKFGFIENKNIIYYYDGATGHVNKLPQASQKIMTKELDLILTLTTPAGIQAQKDTLQNKIPVIFAPASNPVGSGLVKSINEPGANITGVTFGLQEVKRFEWLLKVLPNVKRVYYPYNDKDKSPSITLKQLQEYIKHTDVEIVIEVVKTKEEIKNSLSSLPKDIDAVFIATDALVASNLKLYLKTCDPLKIPITVPHKRGVEQGAFMSYGFSTYELGMQASRMAKEILNGESPSNIPVENSEFKLRFNAQSLKKLGIDVPQNILVQADMVY